MLTFFFCSPFLFFCYRVYTVERVEKSDQPVHQMTKISLVSIRHVERIDERFNQRVIEAQETNLNIPRNLGG